MVSLSENKVAEECIQYAILCLRKKKSPFWGATSREITDLGKDHQWTLKPLSERLLGNSIFTWYKKSILQLLANSKRIKYLLYKYVV